MGDVRRKSEVRQVELTDAALHIIATRGIAALTTRSLADRVGLSSGAIFRHYASLDALLEAVVGRVEGVLASTFPSEELAPRERLEQFVEARGVAVGERVGILRLVLSEQFLLALPKDGSARLLGCVQKTREFLTRCLREGQEGGEFRSDIEASALAAIVMGTIQVLALAASDRRARPASARAVRDGLVLLLQPPVAKRSNSKKKRSK